MLYITLQFCTVQYSTVQYSTVEYSTVQYSTVPCSAVQYSTFSTLQATGQTSLAVSWPCTVPATSGDVEVCVTLNRSALPSTDVKWSKQLWAMRREFQSFWINQLKRDNGGGVLLFFIGLCIFQTGQDGRHGSVWEGLLHRDEGRPEEEGEWWPYVVKTVAGSLRSRRSRTMTLISSLAWS